MQANHPQNPTTMAPALLSQVNYAAGGASDVEFLRNFPPGYRFRPTEKEIILEYLTKKINNEALPPNLINTVQLYAFSPDDLSERFTTMGDGEWYFFTPREKKYRGGKRPDRAAGDGYWKATGADVGIMHNGEQIGWRRALAYFKGKHQDSTKTVWLMHEFRAMNSITTQEDNIMKLDDWVLCKVYKKLERSRKRKHDEEVKDGELNNTAHNEAMQLSVESSIVISGPSSSSSSDGEQLTFPNNLKRLCYESKPSCGWTNLEQNMVGSSSNGNIHDGAINEEGIDSTASKAAMHLHVESSHQISTTSSNMFDMLLPTYRQQFPSIASESCYWRGNCHSHLQVQQEHDQLNVEHQAFSQLHEECPYPFSGPSSSSLSHDAASLLPLPYHHQQGPAFKSESVNGMATYSRHF